MKLLSTRWGVHITSPNSQAWTENKQKMLYCQKNPKKKQFRQINLTYMLNLDHMMGSSYTQQDVKQPETPCSSHRESDFIAPSSK